MPFTFKQIKEFVAPYAGRSGKCATSAQVPQFARSVMEQLLITGSSAAEKTVSLVVDRGCFSLPPEVEIPIKVRIDRQVGNVWNKWFSYHSASSDMGRCFPAGEYLIEDGEMSPLAYSLPEGGGLFGVQATCDEDTESFVFVQGKDVAGREVYTMFEGEKIPGEKFRLVKNNIRFGKVVWGHISAVTKSVTNGYVVAYAVHPQTHQRKFIADWSPSEERPFYRRFRVIASEHCNDKNVHISMLCRMKLKDNYHDNEITFFDNQLAIQIAAQRIQAENNNDLSVASAKLNSLRDSLNDEGAFKKPPSSPIDVFYPLSGGTIGLGKAARGWGFS